MHGNCATCDLPARRNDDAGHDLGTGSARSVCLAVPGTRRGRGGCRTRPPKRMPPRHHRVEQSRAASCAAEPRAGVGTSSANKVRACLRPPPARWGGSGVVEVGESAPEKMLAARGQRWRPTLLSARVSCRGRKTTRAVCSSGAGHVSLFNAPGSARCRCPWDPRWAVPAGGLQKSAH